MFQQQRSRNQVALGLLIVGKLFGIAGLALGSTSRVLGGTLLGVDGLLIVVAVTICVVTMKAREREDANEKQVLRQMMKEGTLKQYLRDLEAEERGAPADRIRERERDADDADERTESAGQTAFT
ncbi:MAG: hypothetical protein KIS78_17665 [Labilithrix sp.]|nr:hypothetical protein [Labilithrix sp.]MCW5834230.1 hypothetical protein [Labilithrix sp.]